MSGMSRVDSGVGPSSWKLRLGRPVPAREDRRGWSGSHSRVPSDSSGVVGGEGGGRSRDWGLDSGLRVNHCGLSTQRSSPP